MKKENITKKILFNILLILTIILIFFIFFPKKSYIEKKLEQEDNPVTEEYFNNNINSLKIASINYFKNSDTDKITLKELIEKNLLVELIDSNGNTCSNDSYAKKENDKIIINLKCSDKEAVEEIKLENKSDKLLCLYEYRKEEGKKYTDWSEWSDWSTTKKEKNDLTNVETKTEQISDGTEIITNTKEIDAEPTKNVRLDCPEGYIEENSVCKKKIETNSINASISYSCPPGYSRNGLYCYSNENKIEAEKKYYCPNNQENTEFELSGNTCKVYNIKYYYTNMVEYYYTCPSEYKLKDNRCYKTETYEDEVIKYKEETYYRYQTRKEINAKYDIIWSSKDNKELLDNSYNMIREISCDF